MNKAICELLVLRTMKAEGLIASTGKGRGAKWVSLANTKQKQVDQL